MACLVYLGRPVAGGNARCLATDDAARDWRAWRMLATQDGGRVKPLDSLARETLRRIADRSSVIDPETQHSWEPVAAYLAMLFDWGGWDLPHRPSGATPVPRRAVTSVCTKGIAGIACP